MSGELRLVGLSGIPEVVAGDDLATLLHHGIEAAGLTLEPWDALVVSSKVVSKALGLTTCATDRAEVSLAESVRVVAERVSATGHVTRIVEAKAGPVMAAAGVDGSNTGASGDLLLLPHDPDAEAVRLRDAVRERTGLAADAPVAVVLSDTAGRPWRAGLTDFALGSAGLAVLDDHRGGVDHDGRPLVVTARAVADEVAAAADLVKGKVDGVPAALVRGLPRECFSPNGPGARSLVRTGAGDWFALGHVEAVRAALGVGPGTGSAVAVGIAPAAPSTLAAQVERVVALALWGEQDAGCDVEVSGDRAVVTLTGHPYAVGRLAARLETAAASEHLRADTGSGQVTVLRPAPT